MAMLACHRVNHNWSPIIFGSTMGKQCGYITVDEMILLVLLKTMVVHQRFVKHWDLTNKKGGGIGTWLAILWENSTMILGVSG
jgi:hypothetical protein